MRENEDCGSEKGRKYLESRKEQLQRGLIQVHVTFDDLDVVGVAGESLWAYPIGDRYAQIANIPFFSSDIGMDDVVETEVTDKSMREFVAIVKKNSNTYFAKYPKVEDENELWEKLRKYFLEKGLRIEGAASGLFAICSPIYLSDDSVDEIVRACPYGVLLCTNSEEIPEG
jgi:hypothetical protein